MGGDKASKSLGNVVYLSELLERDMHPLSLRYFFLQAHYRTPLSFSWEALAAAESALTRLWKIASEVREESGGEGAPSDAQERFLAFMRDDLATPQALGALWEALRSDEYTPEEKWGLLTTAETHFGLTLLMPPAPRIVDDAPADVRKMVARREAARTAKDFDEADRLRAEISKSGYRVDDKPQGPVLHRQS